MKKTIQKYIEFVKMPTYHRAELMSVQWLRGLAVMMVLVYHVEDLARLLPDFKNFRSFWMDFGYSAPDLFFVISGFIMSYVTFGMKFDAKHWLLSRFIRIYPMYILFTFLAFCVWMINPSMTMGSGVQTWSTILQSFLIIPQAKLPLIFVGWTVEHEIVFYALVFLVAVLGWGQRGLLAVTGGLSVLATARYLLKDYIPWLDFWDFHFLSLFMLQFFMGAAIFSFKNIFEKTGVIWPILFSIALFILGGLFAKPTPINYETLLRVILFGLSFSALLVSVLNWEIRERLKKGEAYPPKKRPFFVIVGDSSYSLYLIHPFCLSVSGKILNMLGVTGWTALAGVIGAGIGTVLAGIILYNLLEKPFLQAMKISLLRKKRTPSP